MKTAVRIGTLQCLTMVCLAVLLSVEGQGRKSFTFSSVDELKKNLQRGGEVRKYLESVLVSHISKTQNAGGDFCNFQKTNKRKNCTESVQVIGGNNTTYRLYACRRRYARAEDFCNGTGGRLAALGAQNVTEMRKLFLDSHNLKAWVGLKKIQSGRWVWSDGTQSNQNDSYWDEGQPQQEGEDCGLLNLKLELERAMNGTANGLHDYPCNKAYRFICEYGYKNSSNYDV